MELSYDLWYMIIRYTSPEIRRYLMHTCQVTRRIIFDWNFKISILLHCKCKEKCYKLYLSNEIGKLNFIKKCIICNEFICSNYTFTHIIGDTEYIISDACRLCTWKKVFKC
jgi:hypothetical protein